MSITPNRQDVARRQQPGRVVRDLGSLGRRTRRERIGDPARHRVVGDVDPLHRQDHVAQLADPDQDDLGGGELLADLGDARRVAGTPDQRLIEVVAVHRARLVLAEHLERGPRGSASTTRRAMPGSPDDPARYSSTITCAWDLDRHARSRRSRRATGRRSGQCASFLSEQEGQRAQVVLVHVSGRGGLPATAAHSQSLVMSPSGPRWTPSHQLR